jgi:hypothetical protein
MSLRARLSGTVMRQISPIDDQELMPGRDLEVMTHSRDIWGSMTAIQADG